MIAISDIVNIRRDVPSGPIILNREEKCNALSREMITMLQQAFDDMHQEKNVRAVILTGAGRTFCAGTDLRQLQETMEDENAFQTWYEDVQNFQNLIETMLRFPKPIIAAVNGTVVGAGLALMLACDLVIADENAQLLVPEAQRGLNPGFTTPLLSFRIGAGQAANVLFSGIPISAQIAENLGLFHEVVSHELVWARGHEAAKTCSSGAHESYQLIKKMLNETVGETLFTQLSIAAANMAAARTTEAAKEGIHAFLEKRPPEWG